MKLKKGVEIYHKRKTYIGKIPDDVFEEIYGENADKAKQKLKQRQTMRELFQEVE